MLFDDMNSCNFTGIVAEDYKLEELKTGKWKLTFALGVNSSYQAGATIISNPFYAQCQKIFNKRPVKVLKYFKKGNRLRVSAEARSYKAGTSSIVFFNISTFTVSEMVKESQIEQKIEEVAKNEIIDNTDNLVEQLNS